MKYKKGKRIPVSLNQPTQVLLEKLLAKFNNMLLFIQKNIDEEIRAGRKNEITEESLELLVRRIAKNTPKFLARSAVDCFKHHFDESYEPGKDIVTYGEQFLLTDGFSLSRVLGGVDINGEGIVQCSITYVLPFDKIVSRVRFIREEDDKWFVVFYTMEFEMKESLKEAETLEEWAKVSYPEGAKFKNERFYQPEKTGLRKWYFDLSSSRANMEVINKHALVYTATYNILLDCYLRNFDLSKVRFVREKSILRLFTQLKGKGYIKLFDTSDTIIRSVCREVAATLMFIINTKPKEVFYRNPFEADSFFYTLDRADINLATKEICFPRGVLFKLEGEVVDKATVDIVAMHFKKMETWKVKFFQMTEAERRRREGTREKWKAFYKQKSKKSESKGS